MNEGSPSAFAPALRRVAAGAGLIGIAAAMAIGAHVNAKRQLSKVQVLNPPAIAGAEPGGLLIIGDSRVAQWPTDMIPANGTVVGFSGAAAISIAEAAGPIYAAFRPRRVVIQAGFNDASAAAFALSGRERETILSSAAEAVARMAREARTAGAERIVIMTVAPAIRPELPRRLLYGGRQDAAVAELNRQLRNIRGPRISVLEVELLLGGAGNRPDPIYRTDSVHWSPAAYDRISGALSAMLDPDRAG